MSQSPTNATDTPGKDYMNAWEELATRIRHGNSFSGREPNCFFLNTQAKRFANASMVAGLGFPDDGRAVAKVDWDGDGDLDLWFTNRTAPRVRFLRNDLPKGAHSLSIQLQGDPSKFTNRDAIGARIRVGLRDGRELTRTLVAGDGFLSQSSKWVHFGLGAATEVRSVSVDWPSNPPQSEAFPAMKADQRIRLVQGTGKALGVKRSVEARALAPSEWSAPPAPNQSRVTMKIPVDFSALVYRSWTGDTVTLDTAMPTVVLLWASWCQPCLKELASLAAEATAFEKAGLRLLALNIEDDQPAGALQASLRRTAWPFASGRANRTMLDALDAIRLKFVYKAEPLPLPSSFLLHQGKLVSLQKGAADLPEMLAEAKRLSLPSTDSWDHAVPFPGRWSTASFVTNPVAIAKVYLEDGYTADARRYLERSLKELDVQDARLRSLQEADIYFMLAETDRLERRPLTGALSLYEKAYERNPMHPMAAVGLGRAYVLGKQPQRAIQVLEAFLKGSPQRPDALDQLGAAYLAAGRAAEASSAWERALTLAPKDLAIANQLCWLYATHQDVSVRNAERAMKLGQQLLQAKGAGANPVVLDTVAAALANAGRFAEAEKLIARAVPLAKGRGNVELATRAEQRRQLYQQRKPYRE